MLYTDSEATDQPCISAVRPESYKVCKSVLMFDLSYVIMRCTDTITLAAYQPIREQCQAETEDAVGTILFFHLQYSREDHEHTVSDY